MNRLSLQEVTRENWRATLDLAVFPDLQIFQMGNAKTGQIDGGGGQVPAATFLRQ